VATVKVVGFATIELPKWTSAQAPGPYGKATVFRRNTSLRVPLGTNVIVADRRSLIPAALVTMFGIGAELGILGVLAFSLSDQATAARYSALAAVIVMAVTVLAYAIATTLALADSRPGSALTDAPMLVKGFRVTFFGVHFGVLNWNGDRGAGLLGCGQDREGPLG
jgi:hypothetical protein